EQAPVETRADKGLLVLRIRHPVEVTAEKERKLTATAVANCLGQRRVGVTREVQKRGGLPVFLTHEQERHIRAEKQEARQDLLLIIRQQGTEPLTQRAIPCLIMILRVNHEAL